MPEEEGRRHRFWEKSIRYGPSGERSTVSAWVTEAQPGKEILGLGRKGRRVGPTALSVSSFSTLEESLYLKPIEKF